MSQHACPLCSEECPQDGTLCEHCKEADTLVSQVIGKTACNLCGQMSPRFQSSMFRDCVTWCYECAVAVTRFATDRKYMLTTKEGK